MLNMKTSHSNEISEEIINLNMYDITLVIPKQIAKNIT